MWPEGIEMIFESVQFPFKNEWLQMSGLHFHFLHKVWFKENLLKQRRASRKWLLEFTEFWQKKYKTPPWTCKKKKTKKKPQKHKHKERRPNHWLALVSALAHFVVKVHLDLQDELQLLVGAERRQRAVDLLAGVHGLPVVLIPQVHFVAAGRLLVVVPAAWAFLCRGGETLELRAWWRDNSHVNQVNGSATLTVEAHWLGHTYDILHLVVSVGETKPLLLRS